MSREGQDFGPTVVDGFVRRTSVSALTSFDTESYAGCPLRWWWQRVGGKSEPETKAQGGGKSIHSELEEYEKTGNEIVLGPIAREGKHLLPKPASDLVIEANFGDLAAALKLREARAAAEEIRKHAGLTAGSIPLDGYIDLKHERGEYIDGAGLLHKEKPEHGRVVEVVDHKSTSSIDDYSKSPSEMAETIQMVGYANFVLNTDPTVDHVRVSHIYYQTRGPKRAKKITALLSASAAREKWHRVDKLAVYMEEVARQTRPEDVEAVKKSCQAYRGCPHIGYCPGATRTFIKQGDQRMSLFNTTTPPSTTNGTPAPVSGGSLFGSVQKTAAPAPAQDRAAIDAAKAKLAAEDAPAAPAVAYGFCNKCGTPLTSANASKSPSGNVNHIGCSVVAPGQIVPSDAARPTLAQSAMPVPLAELAKTTDPEIQRRAAEVQAAHDVEKAAAKDVKTGGRCAAGGQVHKVTPKEATTRKTKCPACNIELKIKDDEFNETCDAITIRNHNMPKVIAPPQAAPVPVPAPQAAAPVHVNPTSVPVQIAPVQPKAPAFIYDAGRGVTPSNGISLFVDTVVERGARPQPLEDYYLPKVRELEEQHGAADLRCADPSSALGYGKWKGALAAFVRATPPAPGVYFARSSNEIEAVVIEALAPMCETVARGVR
jgi:hypothetical protein